jgi:hypothetical protein
LSVSIAITMAFAGSTPDLVTIGRRFCGVHKLASQVNAACHRGGGAGKSCRHGRNPGFRGMSRRSRPSAEKRAKGNARPRALSVDTKELAPALRDPSWPWSRRPFWVGDPRSQIEGRNSGDDPKIFTMRSKSPVTANTGKMAWQRNARTLPTGKGSVQTQVRPRE